MKTDPRPVDPAPSQRWPASLPTQEQELAVELRRRGVRNAEAAAKLAEESLASIFRGDPPVGLDELQAAHDSLLAQESDAG